MSSESNNVLVVEDEPTVRALVLNVLAGEGYDVLDTGDPWEALGVAQSYPIRLLVTDMVMPEMGGLQLTDILTAQRPELRVLYMSGYADDEVLQHARVIPTPH